MEKGSLHFDLQYMLWIEAIREVYFIAIRIKSNMEKTQERQIVKNILKKYMRMFYRDCRMIFRKNGSVYL